MIVWQKYFPQFCFDDFLRDQGAAVVSLTVYTSVTHLHITECCRRVELQSEVTFSSLAQRRQLPPFITVFHRGEHTLQLM